MKLVCQVVKDIQQVHIDLIDKINHESGTQAIINHIKQGNIVLHEVLKDDQLIGIFGNCVDTLLDDTKELVHLFTVSNDHTLPFGLICGMYEEIIAYKAKLPAIRLHTNTRAAGRYMEQKLGYVNIEQVYRKKLDYVSQSK